MRQHAGFTLIELILVTVIIGILAGMVVANFAGRLGDAQRETAKGDISTYSGAVDLYALDHNDKYPQSLEDLVGGDRIYVREVSPDPWDNPYNYTPPTTALKGNFKVWSSGLDGISGTEDDVTSSSP